MQQQPLRRLTWGERAAVWLPDAVPPRGLVGLGRRPPCRAEACGAPAAPWPWLQRASILGFSRGKHGDSGP
eukprot:3763836-Alexandrium_andersonii.AAC.1